MAEEISVGFERNISLITPGKIIYNDGKLKVMF